MLKINETNNNKILFIAFFVHDNKLWIQSSKWIWREEFFNKSDIVFLGGSLIKKGGHNPIEAALANCAIISGPYVFNWQNLYEEMMDQNSCLMINEAKELEIKIINLIKNKNLLEKYKKNALTFSNTVFFKEDKLIKLLNYKLRYNA